jgi:predicted secreted Zn-dependent protease
MRKLCLFCFLLIVPTANAEVTETLEYNYYVANADAGRSLLNILNASSPVRHNGQIFHAHTQWNIRWNFRWQESPDGRCRVTSAAIALSGNIDLPRLVGATPAQEGQFSHYLAALRTHELGHYDIGNQAASTIDRKILSLPEMPSCSALESTVNTLGYQTLDEYKTIELRYDTSTGHGKSQGAWLDR